MSIHLFDVDYTLIRKSSSYYFIIEGLRTGVLSFRQFKQLPFEWFRYKIGLANEDFIEQAVKHLGGIDEGVVKNLAEACFIRYLKPNIYTEGAALIRDLLSRGDEVRLATSSFQTLIHPLEEFFHLPTSIASVLEFIGGKTSGHIAGNALFGQNKKNAVLAWLQAQGLPPEDLWFYSDSYTDLPALEYAGHPVAVNPDRFLAREAKKRGWPLVRWRETLGG
jgi:HAD superfamily hydrolase (TIGR01490 family)